MAVEMNARLKARIEPWRAWIKEAPGESDARAIEILIESRDAILAAMRDLSEQQSRFSPSEDEWCVHEIGRHLIHFHTGISGGIQLLAARKRIDHKGKPGVVPEGPEQFEAVCRELENSYGRLEEAFAISCAAGVDSAFTIEHPYLGPLDAGQWFLFCTLHTNIHIEQIERIIQSEGFPVSQRL